MRIQFRSLYLKLLTFALLTVAQTAVNAHDANGAIRTTLDPYVKDGQLSGYVTLLMKGGKEIGSNVSGFADIGKRTPMRKNTIFRAYSMTKPVTGVALMILHQRGKWNFSDPIAKYLPELADLRVYRGTDASGKFITSPAASQPTMEQLVSHTAGFLYGFGNTAVDQEYQQHIPLIPTTLSTSEYLHKLAAIPLAYDPGTQWQYSVGMDLEGIIVERLSGLPLRTFMRREIFTPLKMKDTDFLVPAEKRSRFATLYEMKNAQLTPVTAGQFAQTYSQNPVMASGGGGLATTASDYARFASMLDGGGRLDGKRILTRKSVETIMSSHIPPEFLTQHFGIGFQHLKPGYEFGINGVVVTDPVKANVPLGKGSYLWDGAAGTWFWVDPTNHIVFVGMIQRMFGLGAVDIDDLTHRVVAANTNQPPPNK